MDSLSFPEGDGGADMVFDCVCAVLNLARQWWAAGLRVRLIESLARNQRRVRDGTDGIRFVGKEGIGALGSSGISLLVRELGTKKGTPVGGLGVVARSRMGGMMALWDGLFWGRFGSMALFVWMVMRSCLGWPFSYVFGE